LAYFDAGCDLTVAAKRLCIHRNTLRYRLQRIEALCAVSLDDAVSRFIVELQVRLHFLAGIRT
jgi:DNA-binding PucR family transcriptional regulator